jgi:hypothetical protein
MSNHSLSLNQNPNLKISIRESLRCDSVFIQNLVSCHLILFRRLSLIRSPEHRRRTAIPGKSGGRRARRAAEQEASGQFGGRRGAGYHSSSSNHGSYSGHGSYGGSGSGKSLKVRTPSRAQQAVLQERYGVSGSQSVCFRDLRKGLNDGIINSSDGRILDCSLSFRIICNQSSDR